MKLLQLLARELKEWPEEATMAVQDADGQIKMAAGENPQNRNGQDRVWVRDDEVDHKIQHRLRELATDHATAIVTRADWQAEKARIAGKVDGGWKRHKRKSQPVSDGAIVEIRTRGGEYETCEASCFSWGATGNSQIMAYRIHKPAEQPAPVSEEAIQVGIDAADAGKLTPIAEVKARIPSLKTERALKDAREGNTAKFSSIDELMQDLGEPMPQPLAWRDRIRTLDTQRAELEATYQRQIGEIDGERVELVRRLASEGLALVEVVQQAVQWPEGAPSRESAPEWATHIGRDTLGFHWFDHSPEEFDRECFLKGCLGDAGYRNGRWEKALKAPNSLPLWSCEI